MGDGHCCASEARRALKCSGSQCSGKLILEGRTGVVSAPRPLGSSLAFMRIGRYYDKESSLAMRPERQE